MARRRINRIDRHVVPIILGQRRLQPAALKAWIDMVVRAKEAFQYTSDGPEGLLRGKTAYVVMVSGGTKIGGEVDFAWPHLRHVLGFIGITDVRLIPSDLGGRDADAANAQALAQIAEIDTRVGD